MNYYAYQGDEKKTARSTSRDLNASWKHLNEICHAIKGMKIERAIAYLNEVLEMEKVIPMRRYNTGVPHRVGGQPGRYLTKSVKIILGLVENAKANAEFKELNIDHVKIVHATGFKASTLGRTRPKGKAKTADIDLANVEIVVKEV